MNATMQTFLFPGGRSGAMQCPHLRCGLLQVTPMALVENILAFFRRVFATEYSSLTATVETETGLQNTDAFLAELKKITRQTGEITHAFSDPDCGVIGYAQLFRAGGTITIHRIWTIYPKRGHGSKMLRQICALADRHQVFIQLKIAPLGRKPYPMSSPQLRQWYHRHGFRGEKKLIRSPSM